MTRRVVWVVEYERWIDKTRGVWQIASTILHTTKRDATESARVWRARFPATRYRVVRYVPEEQP